MTEIGYLDMICDKLNSNTCGQKQVTPGAESSRGGWESRAEQDFAWRITPFLKNLHWLPIFLRVIIVCFHVGIITLADTDLQLMTLCKHLLHVC